MTPPRNVIGNSLGRVAQDAAARNDGVPDRSWGPDMQPKRQDASRVAPVVFTTEHLPPGQRLDAWNAAFGTLNHITPAAPDLVGPMRSANWRLGAMVLSVNSVPDSRFQRDAAQARRDQLDHFVIRVLREGRSLLRHPGFTASVGPGEPVLFSMDECWATTWQGAEWVSITVPRDLHPQLARGLAVLPRGPLRGSGAGMLAQALLALPKQLDQATEQDLPVLAEVARSIIAACLLTGAPVDAEAMERSRKEQVRRAIQAHLGSALLTPARLAGLVGISRSALYRMFEEEGGVAHYIRDIRLAFAHEALRDPAQAHRNVAEIAEACGFPDPSVFTRSFRRAYGVAPRDVRVAGAVATPLAARQSTRIGGSDLAMRLYRPAA